MNQIEQGLNTYHWLMAVMFAMILHAVFLFAYQPRTTGISNTLSNADNKEIVISLKKIKESVSKPISEQKVIPPAQTKKKKPQIIKPKVNKST